MTEGEFQLKFAESLWKKLSEIDDFEITSSNLGISLTEMQKANLDGQRRIINQLVDELSGRR